MRRLLITALAGSGLFLTGLTASAQYAPRDEYRYQTRDDGARLLDRVRADLDRAEAATLPFTGDRARVVRAQQEVSEFQRRLDAGDYDRRGLDEAIANVQSVMDANHVMSDRTRDDLAADTSRLRELRLRLDRDWR